MSVAYGLILLFDTFYVVFREGKRCASHRCASRCASQAVAFSMPKERFTLEVEKAGAGDVVVASECFPNVGPCSGFDVFDKC